MRRIKPQTTPQEPVQTHGSKRQEITLLIAYLVICLLSFLTVLMPTTENKADEIETKARSSVSEPGHADVPK
jgi:hypothetical protein